MPKPYVPMAMPVRLTDNNMCKGIAATSLTPAIHTATLISTTLDDP
jgi:hypothetical protein